MPWLLGLLKSLGNWILPSVITYLATEVREYFNERKRNKEREAVQKEKKHEWEQIRNNPTSTPEEIGKAYADFINSSN